MPTTAPIYQLKITLRGSRPPIWRRILVPANITLARLHEGIQIAMGWTNSHLYEFQAQGEIYGPPDPDFESGVTNDRRVRLDRVLAAVHAKISYTYDLGDSWEHIVELEKVLAAEP